ncbi:MAG: DUF4863 domain-containing protein [Rhodospirillaceae bacterium]|jgi:hypothetical protein|nr:DUF4863 domain-containing protein [Rhodospirillaceae bacterium]
MTKEEFQELVQEISSVISGKPLDHVLSAELNEKYPPESNIFNSIRGACDQAIADGWMCNQEHRGIKFGRIINDLDGFSVDVVEMNNVVGPHHRHPKGEINMIMPIEGDAKFDDNGEGWFVYGPDTAHRPTVTDGNAIVLYLLPDGEIEFTGK